MKVEMFFSIPGLFQYWASGKNKEDCHEGYNRYLERQPGDSRRPL
jgi:hypothetical protein